MSGDDLEDLARRLGESLRQHGLVMSSAESCTGGWIAKCVTDIAGSSAWLDRSFVTYSNAAKQDMLGVKPATLDRHGAVSEPTVREMTQGALDHSLADLAVAVSGVAGPGGGSPDKPVGTVYLAWQRRGAQARVRREHFAGDRDAVRRQTVALALAGLIEMTEKGS